MTSEASFRSPNPRYSHRRQVSHSQSSSGIPQSSYSSTSPYLRFPPTSDTSPQTLIPPRDSHYLDPALQSGSWVSGDSQPRDDRDDILSPFAAPGLVSAASLATSSPISVQLQPDYHNAFPDLYSHPNMQPNVSRLSVPSLNIPVEQFQGLMQPQKRRRTLGGRSVSEYSTNSQMQSGDQYMSPIVAQQGDDVPISMQGFQHEQVLPPNYVPKSRARPSLHTSMPRSPSQSSYATRYTDHQSSPLSPPSNWCDICEKRFDKKNEFNKHMQSHEKRFYCQEPNCPRDRADGFTTQNDLDRHKRTVHHIYQKGDKFWICPAENCTAAGKHWPRWDNFKQHVVRMHETDWPGGKDEALQRAGLSFTIIDDPAKLPVSPKDHSHREKSFAFLAGPAPNPAIQVNGHLEREQSFEQISTQIQSDMHPDLLRPPPHPMGRRHGPPPKQRLRRRTGKGVADRRPSSPCPPGPQFGGRAPYKGSATKSVVHVNDMPDGGSLMWHSNHTTAAPEEVYLRNQAQKTEGAGASSSTQFPVSAQDDLTQTGSHMDPDFKGDMDIDLEANDNVELTGPAVHRPELVRSMQRAMELLSDPTKNTKEGDREFRTMLDEIYKHSSNHDAPTERSLPGSRPGQPKQFKCTVKIMENDIEVDCPKSFDKHNELKKHIRRHSRLYGCTDDKCFKRFGSKWEWKRHENKQHEQRQCWRCDIRVRPECKPCAHICNNVTDFRNHLQTEHLECKDDYAAIGKRCRICHKWQGSFWCGFCEKVISNINAQLGNERNNHRFEHIHEHLTSKTNPKKIEDWVNLEGCGKTKGESQQPSQHDMDEAEDTNEDEDTKPSRSRGLAHDDSAAAFQSYGRQQNIDEDMNNEGDEIRLMNAFGQMNDAERPSDETMYDGTANSYTEMMGEDFNDLFEGSVPFET